MPVDSSLVSRSACLDGVRLATLVPASPSFVYAGRTIAPEQRYLLSRFAYVHRESAEMILESPRAHARITLHGWRSGALVHALAEPRRARELANQIPSLTTDAAAAVMTLLLNAGMLEEQDERGSTGEDTTPALQSWEFHDLLFHARSRGGRHDAPIGATYRLVGRLDPAPPLKPARSGETFPLHLPDVDRLEREDLPFARVQEARRSIRDYARRPVSAHQLGEFLYRVGRVADYRITQTHTPQGSITTEHAPRPYPAGGALYELELYIAVNACEDLAAGLYHYDPEGHRLIRLCGRTADVACLLADAGRATAIPAESLQVLIIIAARFRRIAWKYASIAYALTLKHVGVLTQTMYLVATAMDLAPCSAGVGDSDLFARTAGTDYYDETSVGEFLLGSKPR
jgi:SagB-type dehydrogenase family enzyme